ncbi:MAG: hypothetical protein HC866_06655 [Leptolyngbyaceae cyanobacterium RU_5_1]|nr:hypothetical protein [Leptolyngbyaceae cyanobacterium RU_5_1]
MRVWIVLKIWLRIPVWSSGLLIAAPVWSNSLPNSPNHLSHSAEQTAINQALMPEQTRSSPKLANQTKETSNSQTANSLTPLSPKGWDASRTLEQGDNALLPKALFKSDFTSFPQSNKAADLVPVPLVQSSAFFADDFADDFMEYKSSSITVPELARSLAASTIPGATDSRVAQADTGDPQPLQPPRSPTVPINPADPSSPPIIQNTPPPAIQTRN